MRGSPVQARTQIRRSAARGAGTHGSSMDSLLRPRTRLGETDFCENDFGWKTDALLAALQRHLRAKMTPSVPKFVAYGGPPLEFVTGGHNRYDSAARLFISDCVDS